MKTKTKNELFRENLLKPKRKPTVLEKIQMFGVAFQRLLVVSTKNHIYSFKGQKRVKENGMPTGLDATGALADLVMLWWDQKFIEMLNACNLELDLFFRFKDDGNIIMDKLTDEQSDIFKIIDRNNLKYSPEDPSFTANVICELANQVDSMISFTFDTPHLNENHKLPILDVKVALNE